MTERDQAAFLVKMSVDAAAQWLTELIEAHERGIIELKRRRDQFIAVTQPDVKEPDLMRTPVNVLSWAVNDVRNIHTNLRLDLACNHAAALSMSAAKLEALS
jgi:hypothetical protein